MKLSVGMRNATIMFVSVLAHRCVGRVCANECLRSHVSGDDDDDDDDVDMELLVLGARKLRRICCTGSLPWNDSGLSWVRPGDFPFLPGRVGSGRSDRAQPAITDPPREQPFLLEPIYTDKKAVTDCDVFTRSTRSVSVQQYPSRIMPHPCCSTPFAVMMLLYFRTPMCLSSPDRQCPML